MQTDLTQPASTSHVHTLDDLANLSHGLHTGSAHAYTLLPTAPPRASFPDSTPYWRIELTIDSTGQTLGFDLYGSIIIGRSISADIDLNRFRAHELGVSRHHAFIAPTAHALCIVDADSSNGTIVNDLRLSQGQARVITQDSTIQFGHLRTSLRIIDRCTLGELRYMAADRTPGKPRPPQQFDALAADDWAVMVTNEEGHITLNLRKRTLSGTAALKETSLLVSPS